MSIRNSKDFREELNLYKNKYSQIIYDSLMKEFNIFLEITRLGVQMPDHKTLLTSAFSDFYSLSFMLDFAKKSLSEKSFLAINEYLYNARQKILNKQIKNVVILTANKVEQTNPNFIKFITQINNLYKIGVKVRNTNWYNTDFFKDDILHYDSMNRLQENLYKHFNKFDKNSFNQNINPDILELNLDYKALWNDYFMRIILSSFGRFDIMPKNYIKGQTEEIQKKVLKSIDSSTLVIYYNNVEVQRNHRAAFLNNIKIFNHILENDAPVISVGSYVDLSLIKIISQNNFSTTEDAIEVLGSNGSRLLERIEKPSSIQTEKKVDEKKIKMFAPEQSKKKTKTVEIKKEKTKEIKDVTKVLNKIEDTIEENLKVTSEIKNKIKKKKTKPENSVTNTLNMFWDEEINNDLQKTEEFEEFHTSNLTETQSTVSTKTIQWHAEEINKNKKINFDEELEKNEKMFFSEKPKLSQITDKVIEYSKTIDFNKGIEEEVLDNNSEDFEIVNTNIPTQKTQDWMLKDNQDFNNLKEPQNKLQTEEINNLFNNEESTTKTIEINQEKEITKTINFEDIPDEENKNEISDLLLTVLNNSNIEKVEEYINKLTDYKALFQKFTNLFFAKSNNLKFNSLEVDVKNIKILKEKISAFDFKELNDFINKDFDAFQEKIISGYLSKEDFILYYLIYLKAKLSIDKIEYIQLVS